MPVRIQTSLLGQFLVEFGPLLGFGLEGRLLAPQVGFVVARPACQPAAIELDDPRGQLAQEDPVVGNEQDRARMSHQEFFEPGDGVDVEVVGRLVQQQDVGIADQGLGQQHAALHSRREGRYVGVGIQGHAGKDRVDLLVQEPAAVDLQCVLDPVEPGPQFLAPFRGQTVREVVVLGQHFGPRAEAAGDLVKDGAAKRLGDFLGEHGRRQALLPDDLPAVFGRLAVEQSQKRGLAGAVAPQHADPAPPARSRGWHCPRSVGRETRD